MSGRATTIAGLLLSASAAFAGPFEDCILQNMKGVQAQAAAGAVMRACKEKTTPKRCRGELTGDLGYAFEDSDEKVMVKFSPNESGYAALQEKCIRGCAATSYWSRTFGECSTD